MKKQNVPSSDKGLTPPLKWAGGKRWQVPYLRPIWAKNSNTGNNTRRLVEPFGGGLAITLGLLPRGALLNDINPHLMNFYRWVKETGLTATILRSNNEQVYYEHRDAFNDLICNNKWNTPLAAELFYFLNRTGYNGLCRFNRSGRFNVPFGRYKTISYATDFKAYQAIFAQWDFQCVDFQALPVQPSDFIYADPPYDVEFTAYSQGGFSWDDQVRTAEWLAQHKGPVILVNQATSRIRKLYRKLGYTLRFLDAPRRISSSGDRTPAKELLATRNVV